MIIQLLALMSGFITILPQHEYPCFDRGGNDISLGYYRYGGDEIILCQRLFSKEWKHLKEHVILHELGHMYQSKFTNIGMGNITKDELFAETFAKNIKNIKDLSILFLNK